MRIEHHATLRSTNDRAIQAAAEGDHELPLLILADEQTAGRGRGANRWWTGGGGLAMSLLLGPRQLSAPLRSRAPLAALAAAVAVAESVAPLLPDHQVGLAWPNDVLVGPRKLSGILIEALADGRHVVGIGINTNNSLADAPPDLREQAATLRDLTGRPQDQTQILIGLLGRLERNFAGLACRRPADRRPRRRPLFAAGPHAPRAAGPADCSRGVCRGIAPDGALRLETAAGEELLYSGVLQQATE